MNIRNLKGVTIVLPAFWERISDGGEWGIDENGNCEQKANSVICYFTSEFCESVPFRRSSRPIFVLEPVWSQHGSTTSPFKPYSSPTSPFLFTWKVLELSKLARGRSEAANTRRH
ncbi:hypothetical protein EVAR_10816_1 [Eumeta japonica]|uniref:Uncharacterized protein n=1 Tax=Eumeta variegata TaxID=151549 RepID=A0A4C1Y8G1_EUMVA|nr:hypothetical protein EVAR_10816_1 [Eumeta japonica]